MVILFRSKTQVPDGGGPRIFGQAALPCGIPSWVPPFSGVLPCFKTGCRVAVPLATIDRKHLRPCAIEPFQTAVQ